MAFEWDPVAARRAMFADGYEDSFRETYEEKFKKVFGEGWEKLFNEILNECLEQKLKKLDEEGGWEKIERKVAIRLLSIGSSLESIQATTNLPMDVIVSLKNDNTKSVMCLSV